MLNISIETNDMRNLEAKEILSKRLLLNEHMKVKGQQWKSSIHEENVPSFESVRKIFSLPVFLRELSIIPTDIGHGGLKILKGLSTDIEKPP